MILAYRTKVMLIYLLTDMIFAYTGPSIASQHTPVSLRVASEYFTFSLLNCHYFSVRSPLSPCNGYFER